LSQADRRFQAAIDLNSRFSMPWDEAQVDFKWALCTPESPSARTELVQWATTLWNSIGASRYAELRAGEPAR